MLALLLLSFLVTHEPDPPWEPEPSSTIITRDTVERREEFRPLESLILATISTYQKTLSRAQGDVCNFTPSCSHYGYQAIRDHGLLCGIMMAGDRLERCNFNCWRYSPGYYEVRWVEGRGFKLFDPPEGNWLRPSCQRRPARVAGP